MLPEGAGEGGRGMKLQINNVQAQTQVTPLTSLFKYLVSLVKIHSTSKLLVQRFSREANHHNALGMFNKTSSFLNSTQP